MAKKTLTPLPLCRDVIYGQPLATYFGERKSVKPSVVVDCEDQYFLFDVRDVTTFDDVDTFDVDTFDDDIRLSTFFEVE